MHIVTVHTVLPSPCVDFLHLWLICPVATQPLQPGCVVISVIVSCVQCPGHMVDASQLI